MMVRRVSAGCPTTRHTPSTGYTTETARHFIPILIGQDPLQREQVWNSLFTRVFPLAPGALAAIDIALWDLLGKSTGLPVWRLLGGARNRIPAYASTPMFDDIPAYLKFVEEMIGRGFRAIKFHCWCLPEKDRELAREVRRAFPSDDVRFMLDVENNYSWQDSLETAKELQDLNFLWFEAPLMDHDRDGYRRLTERVDIPVIPIRQLGPGPDIMERCPRIRLLVASPHRRHGVWWIHASTKVHGTRPGRWNEVRSYVVGQYSDFFSQSESHAGDRAQLIL